MILEQQKQYNIVLSQLIEHVDYRSDCNDSESIALEFINLIEECCNIHYQRYIAHKLLSNISDLPVRARGIIRKHFDLYYQI